MRQKIKEWSLTRRSQKIVDLSRHREVPLARGNYVERKIQERHRATMLAEPSPNLSREITGEGPDISSEMHIP
jgi:hypothetical protein